MKKKNLLLTAVATLGLTAATMAQNVPSYVPTNGLVGWWPFNGNANDESGNGNHGVVNGAILTNDRYENVGNAYSFNGVNDYIQATDIGLSGNSARSVSFWAKTLSTNCMGLVGWGGNDVGGTRFSCDFNYQTQGPTIDGAYCAITYIPNTPITNNQWNFFTFTMMTGSTINQVKIYQNGLLLTSISHNYNGQISLNTITNTLLQFGRVNYPNANNLWFWGSLDDIGIWNRALTPQEITGLYNAVTCANNTTITPPTNTLQTGNTASFTAITSDSNPSFVWQSNLGQGFQTLNTIENYSGTNTATLSIANIQLSNHNQHIRVITTSGNCIDTSNTAIISITDTCINSVTDTSLITVTDTLLINTSISGLNPPGNTNTIKIFPNPTNDHITIHYGNFPVMTGYQLRIENSLGQQVFQTNIFQQSDYLSLANWSGNGLYFVHIIDPLGNTIDIRKIVMQ